LRLFLYLFRNASISDSIPVGQAKPDLHRNKVVFKILLDT